MNMGGLIRLVTVKVNPIRTCSQNIWHLFGPIAPSLTDGLLPRYRVPVSATFFAGAGFFFTYLSYQAR
jgi:hypothetical protein